MSGPLLDSGMHHQRDKNDNSHGPLELIVVSGELLL